MKIKTLPVIFLLLLSTPFCFADVDVEFPAKLMFAKTEFAGSYISTDANPFPLPFAGPLKVRKTFQPSERWTTGIEAAAYVYPFFALGAGGYAAFRLCTFKNNTYLELANAFDLGFTVKSENYYNVQTSARDVKFYAGPAAEYFLYLNWHIGPWFTGIGPGISFNCTQTSDYLSYNLNIAAGYRFSF